MNSQSEKSNLQSVNCIISLYHVKPVTRRRDALAIVRLLSMQLPVISCFEQMEIPFVALVYDRVFKKFSVKFSDFGHYMHGGKNQHDVSNTSV